jgi:exopolyphosphatase/guanosine-5'-triphosphate,3'-diphosphate pyrophosphatase
VHDIGCFLSHSNHQRHAYYLVRYSDLLGFNDAEIAVIANVAFYHRKAFPKKRHENLRSLSRQGRNLVGVLAAFLRIAEGLDRSHLSLVQDVRLKTATSPRRLILTLVADADCDLELWGVETNKDLFEHVFGVPLELRVEPPDKPGVSRREEAAVS